MFDLDNTLYPASSAIEDMVTQRMVAFAADFLHISFDEAMALRRKRIPLFGTTMEWLQTEYGFNDPDAFMAAAHPESELSEVEFDPNLRDFLISLKLPLTVLTNSPRIHCDRILRFLNVYDLFPRIYDITFNNYRGKPHKTAFERALKA
jgi:putative hydrolase of the HAD superfamily